MPKQTQKQQIELLESNNAILAQSLHYTQERMSELELAAENANWERLGGSRWDFTRVFLIRIIAFARLMFMKNPLIKCGVWVQTFYVWALGWTVDSVDENLLKVVRGYIKDPKNRALFGQQSLFDMENTRQVTGNLFLVHFVNQATGTVRTRRVEIEEIQEIVYNPSDRSEPWFYVRAFTDEKYKTHTVVYPDLNYNPVRLAIDPALIFPADAVVQWDTKMSHYKTGAFGTMKFGVPEVYASLDWATAYKGFLEDWCTLMRAYSKIAMQMSGNKKGDIPGAKSKLETGRNGTAGNATAAAGFMVSSGGVELKAVKTAGATTSAEEGYSVKLMVAAGLNLPGTFFGDADVGNFATSQTLDRPTELKMVARQGLWKSDFEQLFHFVVLQSAKAPGGILNQNGYSVITTVDAAEGVEYYTVVSPDSKEDDVRDSVMVSFPSILERNATERVRSVIGALTLNGNLPTDVLPDRKFMAKTLLESLGLAPEVVRAELAEMFPPGKPIPDIPPPPPPNPGFGGGSGGSGDSKPKPANDGRKGPAGGSK